MKFRITFKDPDAVTDYVHDAVIESLPALENKFVDDRENDDDLEERIALVKSRHDNELEKIKKFVKWSEYITVEFDTDAGTAIVIENNDCSFNKRK